jgi:hypothetical protein
MSGPRAALEALVASPDTLGVSPASAAELVEGVRGVLRSFRAGADGGDAETVRSQKKEVSMRGFFLLLFSLVLHPAPLHDY